MKENSILNTLLLREESCTYMSIPMLHGTLNFSSLVTDLLCDLFLLPLCNGHKERGLMNHLNIFQVADRLLSGMTQGPWHGAHF